MPKTCSTRPSVFAQILHPRAELEALIESSVQRLPGVQPLNPRHWLRVDSAYDAQMRYRRWLLQHHRSAVLREGDARIRPAALELLDMLICDLQKRDDFQISDSTVIGPDKVQSPIDRKTPMHSIAQITQADYCLLLEGPNGHMLKAAVLCFPASWHLDDKFNQCMMRIHHPVDEIDAKMDQRIENLFRHLRVEQPLWRTNNLHYSDADLHQPRYENQKRNQTGKMRYQRVEFQTLRKLPQSGAVAFGIHTLLAAL